MSCAHQPRPKIDVTAIIEVGITPLGIFVVGETILDDAHHVLRVQHVDAIKVAHVAYFVTYPTPVSATIKELLVYSCCQAITCKFEQLNRFFLRFIQFFLVHTIPPLFQMMCHQHYCLFLSVFYALRHIDYDIFDTTPSSYHPSSFREYGRGGQSSARCTRSCPSLGCIGKYDFQPHRTRSGYLLVSKSFLLSPSNPLDSEICFLA